MFNNSPFVGFPVDFNLMENQSIFEVLSTAYMLFVNIRAIQAKQAQRGSNTHHHKFWPRFLHNEYITL